MTDAPEGGQRLSFDDLAARLAAILERHGCSPKVARLIGGNCAAAERDGAHSHGLFRMKGYVATLKAGSWVDGKAEPVVEDAGPAFVRVDAMNGFTVPALAAARELAMEKVRENGVAVLAIRNSHHLGALSLDVEPFAEEGLVALSFINSMKSVAPFGGHSAVFGTNPIAFASPRAGGLPLVFDMATSVMAHGDVQLAAREGRTLPEGVGVDRDGRATTDPAAIVDGGALLPFGGHKGAALALMVEILCAALVGGKLSAEVDLSQSGGATTPHTGQSFILIDPDRGRGTLPGFASRVETLLQLVAEAGQERLPGDRRHAARETSLREGIFVPAATLKLLGELAA
ncbi:Ldh family oxidoreductase [Aureimonas mangrovi]|uniref:Ldh family oxidoreductase n=1 Tax=Aureimonas mangrovi TaxID=2758041 RepID=UPI00163D5418|nr:Ldh family oxidoreductase [Aureimonas mangrovi]